MRHCLYSARIERFQRRKREIYTRFKAIEKCAPSHKVYLNISIEPIYINDYVYISFLFKHNGLKNE